MTRRARYGFHVRRRVRRAAKSLVSILPLDYHAEWAIGVLSGSSPLAWTVSSEITNPVLNGRDVTDVDALYVADPFVLRVEGAYLMFFEILGRSDNKGRIGLARSTDGVTWTYDRVVLEEPFHLSYPYAFAWDGKYYLLPESHEAGVVRLYVADRFPTSWSRREVLLDGAFADASVVYARSAWWLFAHDLETRALRLFFADRLEGPYVEHSRSPIVEDDPSRDRPAGRILAWDGALLRSTQDGDRAYGSAVELHHVTELTPFAYGDAPLGRVLTGSGRGWNRHGMHHLDALEAEPGRWLAWVDGWRRVWGLRRHSR